MAKLESSFQSNLMAKIKERYPGCMILKNDSGYIQGIPDWTIFYKDRYVVLEAKRDKDAPAQPNQPYYVEKFNEMSYSSFVYPENEKHVLECIDRVFKNARNRRGYKK